MVMTQTERIAVALLGWAPVETPYVLTRGYKQRGGKVSNVCQANGHGDGDWPDFATLDGCRLFEDALMSRALLHRYLLEILRPEAARFKSLGAENDQQSVPQKIMMAALVCLVATCEQRVAACIRVLDEAGL